MIDFHSHILPELDDGSKSVEETFEILEEAQNAGFDTIISTSHYIEGSYEETIAKRQTWIDAITQILEKKSMNLKICLGCEAYITENIVSLLDAKKIATINNSGYVLFEYPLSVKPMNMYGPIYDLINNGYTPILAHPERYSFIQQEPELVYDLIEKGVLMQSNYGSIIGYYGSKAELIVKRLLENNMVHFLGSDVHKPNSVYPHVAEALKELDFLIGNEKIKELTTTNPSLVLQNQEIEIDEPTKFKLSFKEKMMLKKK